MATRSLIGKLNTDGTITNIYCHFDGYPDHNGVMLQEYYNSPAKVDQLLALGNLSFLGSEIGEKQDFNNRNKENDWCLAYGRDRGEKGQEAETVTREEFFNKDSGVDYLYIYNNEFEWECYDAWSSAPVNISAETA